MPLVRPSREGLPSWIRFSLKFGRTRLKNTSFPRLIAGAALSASFAFLPVASLRAQVAQQSYLRNTPSDADREDPRIQAVIARAENHFKLGELNLKDGKREQARDEFDKAVDAVLEAGLDVRAYPRLQQYYLQLVERVYRVEVPTQDQQQRTVVAEAEEEIKNSLASQFKPHPLVLQFINYYQGRGRVTMETGLRRSGQFVPMAREIFRRHGIPEDVVWLGQVESAWRPTARSWAAASGLWQFIPSTGSRFGLRQTAFVDERNSFEKATRASARYLKWLYNRYHNWELALGAYNTGEGNIDRAIARAGTKDFWAIYPYIAKETRDYVPNILAVILISKNPQKYGFRDVQRMPRIDRQYDTIS